MIANFRPTSDVHFTAPTLQGAWGHSFPGILVQLLVIRYEFGSEIKRYYQSLFKLVVSTIRTNLQVNLMLWECGSKVRGAKKKKRKEKRVQLASNNGPYFLSRTEIFGFPMKMVSNASLSLGSLVTRFPERHSLRLLNPFFESPKN